MFDREIPMPISNIPILRKVARLIDEFKALVDSQFHRFSGSPFEDGPN